MLLILESSNNRAINGDVQSPSNGRHQEPDEYDQGTAEAGNNDGHLSFHQERSPDAKSVRSTKSDPRKYLEGDPQNGTKTSALYNYCKDLVARASDEVRMKKGAWRTPRLQHCENLLVVEDMVKAGCSLCGQFLRTFLEDEHNPARRSIEKILEKS